MKYTNEYLKDLEIIWSGIPENINLKGKVFYITGATGLIGSSIADILLRINSIEHLCMKIILAGRNKKNIEERFYPYKMDVDFTYSYYDSTVDFDLDLKADYIIHSAGYADPSSYLTTPVDIMLSNVLGLNTLLRLAKNNKGSRLIYVSSSEVYGNNLKAPYKEDEYGDLNFLDPRACYPSSKRCSETLCIAYKHQFDVDVVIVRPGHIYGPMILESDTKVSSQFSKSILSGKNIILKSSGEQKRSYCYALDCASAMLTVLIKGKSGEAYNISNSKSIVSILELAKEFSNSVGKSIEFDMPSNKEKLSFNLMKDSSLDSSKLEDLGWNALFSLSDGVRKTLDYM